MAPVSTVPAVPTTRNGVRPARRSASMRFLQGVADRSDGVRHGIRRSASLPMPAMSMAFPMQLWAATEV
jgi:hypothetical protein